MAAWGDVGWYLRVLRRRLTRRSGAFRSPELSERSIDLTRRWRKAWGTDTPLGVFPLNPERWVRFHSLPLSKRFADTPAELSEILRRHTVLLSELMSPSGSTTLVVIGNEYGWRDSEAGRFRRLVKDSWPWAIVEPETEDDDRRYLWATERELTDLDDLLIAIADDTVRAAIYPTDFSWAYLPYDGGADVYAPDTQTRDRLRAGHTDWLSAHPLGL